MPTRHAVAAIGRATLLLAASAFLLRAPGLPGAAEAERRARSVLAQLGIEPTGDATAVLEADQNLSWALQRARPGPSGVALARGEGGAVRWRLRFAGGGEASVTAGGVVWSLRRPLPTAPGPSLMPERARMVAAAALPLLVEAPTEWLPYRLQSWSEGGHAWYRARYLERPGHLPAGWRSELEIEIAGSTVIGLRRRVSPLGTDLGVVAGRAAEARVLRQPALLGIGLAVVGMLLAGAEALAFHERVATARGAGAALVVAGLGLVAGADVARIATEAVVTGLAVAFLPLWTANPPDRPRAGPPVGAVVAVAASLAPVLIARLGGWLPITQPLPPDPTPARMIGEAWLPAFAEEPVLRGALPGMTAPLLGWWGGALAGAALGALLHPLPAVPTIASFAAAMVVQVGMVLAARWGGVGAALVARGTCETLLRHGAYPDTAPFDWAAGAVLALGLLITVWRRREA